ncbi:MAG TPA: hypothetical protein VI997_01415 [Candidatus Thermoplasmatota archaeon]|nr:hypothetical protein [Candidatus Thermoplasmatota archaeon]
MIPPKSVLVAELERVLPRAAAREAVEDALRRSDGRGDAFPRSLEHSLARHLAPEDVDEVLASLGYEHAHAQFEIPR